MKSALDEITRPRPSFSDGHYEMPRSTILMPNKLNRNEMFAADQTIKPVRSLEHGFQYSGKTSSGEVQNVY